VDPHTESRFREAQRGGASGHSAADDCHVDAAVERSVFTRRYRIFEPVRVQDVER
jgi:hypothetical protein